MVAPQENQGADKHRQALLVLASTYPRWPGDHEPGFVHELCKRLVDWFDVTVIVPDAPGADPGGMLDGVCVVRYRYAPRRWQTLVNDGGMLANLRRSPWKWILVPPFLGGMLVAVVAAIARKRVDVVHAHWIVPQGLVAALALAARRRAPPLVVTAHGADLFALRGRVFRTFKRAAALRAATVTVVSHAMRREVEALGIDPARIHVRPMGVDLATFAPDAGTARSAAELLFVGRLVEKKGLRYLIDALPKIVSAIPQASLTVAGFGPEMASLRAQVQRLGLEDRVRFEGAVPQSALPALYRRAAAMVAPFIVATDGDREGLGLVMVEALGCGCPVVTTRIEAVRDVFGGNWPRSCAEPGDVDSIATEVIAVLGDPRAARMAVEEGAALRRRFDWAEVAAGYASLLGEAAR